MVKGCKERTDLRDEGLCAQKILVRRHVCFQILFSEFENQGKPSVCSNNVVEPARVCRLTFGAHRRYCGHGMHRKRNVYLTTLG